MKKINLKYIFALTWPFIALIFFLIFAWTYIKPMLPKDFAGFEGVKKIFKKEEETKKILILIENTIFIIRKKN